MKTVFLSVHRILFFAIYINSVLMNSNPPQLLDNNGPGQRIVRPGTPVTLNCPVRGQKDSLLFEWYKDKESQMMYVGARLRISASGALRIKETVLDDTGVYTCRAVNGFGSVEYNVTLLVLGEDEDYELEDNTEINGGLSVHLDESSQKISHLTKPRMIYVTENEPSLHKTPGSTLKLHCVSTGNPMPDVVWYKDGVHVSRVSRRGRWTIHLSNVVENDSGNYTCVASNALGSASYSFIVAVDDAIVNSRRKPVIIGPEPSNTTVEEGQTAVIHCTVRSGPVPEIQWVKQVRADELASEERSKAFKVQGEYFRAVKSSNVVNRQDNNFYSKLVIDEIRTSRAGKYACIGTNIFGYSYRMAHLFVLTKNPHTRSSSIPFPILISVTVVIVAALAGVFALLVYCRKQQYSESRDSSTAAPVVSKEDFLPMRQGSTRATRCSVKPTKSRHKHHTTTTYVPSGEINEII